MRPRSINLFATIFQPRVGLNTRRDELNFCSSLRNEQTDKGKSDFKTNKHKNRQRSHVFKCVTCGHRRDFVSI